ncbi:hypothetical protein NLI96_g11577 [Meripilus lineatus]|uniref:t-SNARE coiled-coil homology domain-containing protein n=1 Tax=Meripilus lineatus TaxID=2056292 RepID=A0AAD5Y905_9APHY|nr:hypothetical protein NLI96_g11577 [Physisporinus lineatus]
MSNVHTGPQGQSSNGGVGDGAPTLFDQVNTIQDSIATLNANVQQIGDLQKRSLTSTDETYNQHNAARLDDLVNQTRDLTNDIKARVKALESQAPLPGEDTRIRKNQISLVRKKFLEALQNYQKVEYDYREKYKQRVKRQFEIVKPDATQEEIEAVVNDTQAGSQIFAQALSSSTRYGESRAAYREVQDRHNDLQKIERTLGELAQLFNDLSEMVNLQDDNIKEIDTAAQRVEGDMLEGTRQQDKAIDSARRARRMRWICFWITVILLIIVAIIVAVVVTQVVKK